MKIALASLIALCLSGVAGCAHSRSPTCDERVMHANSELARCRRDTASELPAVVMGFGGLVVGFGIGLTTRGYK